MPGITSAVVRNNDHHARVSTIDGFWSKHPEELTYNQLQKFWSEQTPQARQKLLRIDKQMVFEQARKNMYCSRCHGLLLEGYLQIVKHNTHNRLGVLKNQNDVCYTGGCSDDIQDSSVHPWGGLTTTRDGMVTLLNCYLYTTSLKSLQNVFESGRARERERELVYPDACGGDGRGWVSQEMGGYGRVHGARESCALHTTRLSVETLVDFWSALGEETRRSLLRMKEEDFMENLVYRFDRKRFCRDCRKNVIREFKELKELKRIRRENRCTTWFCVADAAFQYQVSLDAIVADWHQTFGDTFGSYQHFEWAVGTGEGKSDILEFENLGLNGRVQVKGLDLNAANSCYITLRGWKFDGRCTELSVKAHALKGKPCVHRRLIVGEGFVSISLGDNIRRFFEHAEEAEEDEDDDPMDKDGNELDSEYSRPQKHAKSPELAREFLLDAATVIFKEQIEKAFREGTARQNSHSNFVCLSLKMLEERVHVACKEIITLEKQTKLLEEEEKEKREEEERKERKRIKEKGKKLRRKERQREKENKCSESNQDSVSKADDDSNKVDDVVSETEEAVDFKSLSSDIKDEINPSCLDEELEYGNDSYDPSPVDHFKHSRKEVNAFSKWSDRPRFAVVSNTGNMVYKYEPKKKVNNHYNSDYDYDYDSSRTSNALNKALKNTRSSYIRNGDMYESRSCNCKPYDDRPYYRHNQAEYARDNCRRSRNSCTWDSPPLAKKVWEPLESHKKKHSNTDSEYNTSLKSSALMIEPTESDVFSETPVVSTCNETKEISVQNKCEEMKDVLKTEVKVVNSSSSSCLSEGDSITFSSNANSTESSSSDSEDVSENSVKKESLKCPQNNDFHKDVMIQRKGDTDTPNEGGNLGNNTNIPTIGSQPQAFPRLNNHTIHLPVFQPSPMGGGYYHQTPPFPWTRYPHPNQYIFGYTTNPHFSPYPTLHHHYLPPPPAFHQPYAMGPNLGMFKTSPQPPHTEPKLSNIKKPIESFAKPLCVEKTDIGKDSFSLFHFGGPLDLSTGGGFMSKKENGDDHVHDHDDSSSKINSARDQDCNNNNSCTEEYNLFASSNGINFSFF